MEMQEQEQAEKITKAPVPLATKIGIIALPMLPTIAIDLLTHGGITPPALVAFGLSYAAFDRSPRALAWLGKNETFLSYLRTHPEALSKVDKLSGGYFSKQIQGVPVIVPHEDEPSAVKAKPQVDALGLEAMEDVQPKARVATPVLDFTANDELAPPLLLPDGPLYFSQVLKTFKPTLDKIYLATLPNGKPIYIKARHLCHTALTGSTRGGKSQIIRQLMSQLCYAGAKVYLLNPHYIRYDLEAVDPYGRPCPEDWTPFEAYLKNDPREMIPLATKYRVIEHYLKVAYELVGKRLEIAGESQQRLGAPHFIVIDELPAIVDEVPGATQYLKRILREGAKVGVFVINASQDLQVSTVFQGIGGGVRACYRTAFDVGSDPATQRALGLPVLNGLGKGNVSLRCDEIASAGRVPFVDNEALYALLGPSTYTASKTHHLDEDELMEYVGSGRRHEEETYTEMLPATPRRHVATSGYDAYQQRKTGYKRSVRVQGTPERVVAQQGHSEGTGVYARVPDMVIPERKPEPTIQDALAVWNEVVGAGSKLSRYSLRDKLVEKGFACGENRARDLLEELKAKAEANQSVNR